MAFTADQIGIGLLLMLLVILGVIFALRMNFNGKQDKLVTSKSGTSNKVKKHEAVNAFGFANTNFLLGLVCSVGLIVLLFGWTVYEEQIDEDLLTMENIDDIEQEIPRTAPPPPPPPPPPPVIEEVPDEEVDEDIEFDSQEFDPDEIIEPDPIDFEEEEGPAAPVVEEEEEEEEIIEEVFTVVEDMPSFPGCEDLPTNDERKACTEKSLLTFMYKNIDYPSIARENNIEGLVVVSFVVDKDGSIKEAKTIKDIGGGCGDEAARVVDLMNSKLPAKWTAGKQRSQTVKVKYNLPVRFRLQQN